MPSMPSPTPTAVNTIMKAAAEEAAPQPAQKVAVPPESADGGDNQAAVTPESPRETAGFGADNDDGGGSEDAVTSSTAAAATPPPSAPTPTPSPREPNDKDAAATPASTLPRQESASEAASRTICLRTLPGTKPIGPLPSLAGWGGVTKAAAAAAASTGGQEIAGSGTPPPPEAAAVSGQAYAVLVGEKVGGGGLGVLPSANKVVDLREVKKVKPGPLAASAPVPDDSEGEEEGAGGPVKIDISAGKRMIEFQLKQNAAEEKREAARVKNEKGRADAAIAEGSQRMLAQVNARMEAQRRGRGGGSGVLGSWGAMEENVTSQDDSTTVHAIDQSQIRNLAEKHGIVVRFVDDGAASGVSQVRALARAHGIRILVVGEDGGGGCSDGHGEEEEALAAGGNGGAARSASATPPPTLSSLRTQAAPARRSPSPTPTVPTKAPPKKPSAVPAAAGGMFSGPARMMRRALEASGGCVPSAKDVSPVADRGGDRASPPPGDNQGGSAPPAADARKVLAPTAGAAPVGNGQRARGVASGGDDSMSGKGDGAVRPRPGCAESSADSVGAAAAASNGLKGSFAPGPASRAARSHGESSRRSEVGSRVGAAAAAAAAAAALAATAPDSSAGKLVGRKRRATMGDSSNQERGGEGKGAHDTRAAIRKRAVEGGGGSGTVGGGGRMEGRLGHRGVGPSGEEEEGAAAVSARTSPEAMATPTVQSSAPKRMRLVAPSGLVVSQASATPTTKSGRRASTGGAGWGAGNNNLFKGAMAGIIGRGKRPSP